LEQIVLFPDYSPSEVPSERGGRLTPAKVAGRTKLVLDPRISEGLTDPARVIFLDVETTGLSWFYDEITLVGWARDGVYRTHIAGEDPTALLNSLADAQALVTFNGTLFDLKFLKKTFGEIALPPVHIDLRYLSRRVGLTGGQKLIEIELGVHARNGVEDLDGAAAVLLWHEFVRGDLAALHRLVDYNRRDVLAMCIILDRVVDRLDAQPDFWLRHSKFEKWAGPAIAKELSQMLPAGTRSRLKARTFNSLFSGTSAHDAKIIGIDLTGAEKRASGFCVLTGSNAVTTTVHTDDEMFDRVMRERPVLVSIDSPLSLPEGRIRVGDDDPGRAQFGIMRRCERELKRRGINVYPSLLPSMQGLTQRGIRLAERFRAEGIPVIESYPGAAQDIMGIPRKGAGEKYLRQGLAEFGIRGAYETETVSHDELDAITSAIVGSFFLANQFEALRGPTEGALIIPDLKSSERAGLIVGISGRICAGKTTAARILEREGFAYTRYSLVIDDEIYSRGGIPDRATRQMVGSELHTTKGQRWLGEKAIERVSGERFIVIDGLRFPEDHAFLFETFGSTFLHVHILAPSELRAERYVSKETGDFARVDEQPVEAKISELGPLAAITIENTSSIEDLKSKLTAAVASSRGHGCLSQSS
jgi:predicted nuclease with RNAse H fold/dephospho-CoA kinase